MNRSRNSACSAEAQRLHEAEAHFAFTSSEGREAPEDRRAEEERCRKREASEKAALQCKAAKAAAVRDAASQAMFSGDEFFTFSAPENPFR